MIINGVDVQRPSRVGGQHGNRYWADEAEAYMDTLEAELTRRIAQDEATRVEREELVRLATALAKAKESYPWDRNKQAEFTAAERSYQNFLRNTDRIIRLLGGRP